MWVFIFLPPPPPVKRLFEEVSKRLKLRKKIITYLKNDLNERFDKEKYEILKFLRFNLVYAFPYNFIKKYRCKKVKVYTGSSKLRYVLHDGKRMYFPESWNSSQIKKYYRSVIKEQDVSSPHRYETPSFFVNEGDVVADVGAAEGIFALSIVEKALKIYLFECGSEWTAPLKKTFEPWKEKVVIVQKYVSDVTDDNCVRLDDFIQKEEINFIKADIEGAETALLAGMKNILSSCGNLKIVLCTYHKKHDALELKNILTRNGFKTEYSKGYMICIMDKELDKPYLRRTLIRACK
ncbi:MAG: FkbM family methyltransferase [Spirochaetaceae bacterium]|jgi:hypothetical protein|nr:FkbM family methyltransferase [Spirochaetaceae bacterium]